MDEIREAFDGWWHKENNLPFFGYQKGEVFSVWHSAIDWYKKQPIDPWRCTGDERIDETCDKRHLMVMGTGAWWIAEGNDERGGQFIAMGMNADTARDGEVRTYNPGTGEFEE